ncbi:MAG: hypothetical protein AAGB93_15290 [Planctomycetota bacterium]
MKPLLAVLPALLLLGAPSLAAAPAAAPAPATRVAAPQADLPVTYRGDGMTATLESVDPRSGEISGTITIEGGKPMPFTILVGQDGRGKGEVTAPDRVRTLRTRDIDERTVRVSYRARRYTVVLDEGPAPEERTGGGERGEDAPRRAGGAVERPAAAPTGSVVLTKETLRDPGVRNMESHTVLVPKGWKVEGGGFWAPKQYYAMLPSQDIRVTSPEGVSVRIEPRMTAKAFQPPPELAAATPPTGASDKGFPVVPLPADVGAWKRWMQAQVLPAELPKAKGIRVRDAAMVPELTWELRRRHAPVKQVLERRNGMGSSRVTADAAVLSFECTYDLDGKSYEEVRVVALTYMHDDGPYTGRSTMWNVESAVSYRAPKGELQGNIALLKTIADSVRMTPQWARMRADHFARLMKVSREAALRDLADSRRRSEIISQSGQDLSDIIHAGYQKRQQIRSSSQAKLIHAIQGTEEYSTPGSDTVVHLPYGYDHVYSNGRDEYLLTNDALFQPNVDPSTNGVEWTRMKASR